MEFKQQNKCFEGVKKILDETLMMELSYAPDVYDTIVKKLAGLALKLVAVSVCQLGRTPIDKQFGCKKLKHNDGFTF